VRLENEPRLPSWFVFANPSLHSIPLTTFVLNASISNDDMTRDHHHNNDTNPTKWLRAVRRGEPSHRMATVRAATTIAATTTIEATMTIAAATTVVATTTIAAATTIAATTMIAATTTVVAATMIAAATTTAAAEGASTDDDGNDGRNETQRPQEQLSRAMAALLFSVSFFFVTTLHVHKEKPKEGSSLLNTGFYYNLHVCDSLGNMRDL